MGQTGRALAAHHSGCNLILNHTKVCFLPTPGVRKISFIIQNEQSLMSMVEGDEEEDSMRKTFTLVR